MASRCGSGGDSSGDSSQLLFCGCAELRSRPAGNTATPRSDRRALTTVHGLHRGSPTPGSANKRPVRSQLAQTPMRLATTSGPDTARKAEQAASDMDG